MKKIIPIIISTMITGIGFILVGLYYQKNNVLNGLILIGLCILWGVIVKLMDQLIDEKTAKSYRIWIIPLAFFIPISMVYIALTEEPVIGMVVGTAIGLLIAGKLDHPMYLVSVILFVTIVVIVSMLSMVDIKITTFYIIPVAATGSFLDEFVHERWKSGQKIVMFILKHRFFLKAFAVLGFLLGYAHLVHLIGFLCFDIFYDIVDTAWQYELVNKKIPTT